VQRKCSKANPSNVRGRIVSPGDDSAGKGKSLCPSGGRGLDWHWSLSLDLKKEESEV